MAISITAVDRENGPNCDHVIVTVNDEGTPRTFKTSFAEIDALFSDMSNNEQKKMLVLLWARYRRAASRAVVGVNIA